MNNFTIELELNLVYKMKILAIFSSPSSKGNTAVLVKECAFSAQNAGAEVEIIDLAKENLMFCKGCMSCMRTGTCPLPDNLESVRSKMNNADGLILGSPVYALNPNAIMKNFLDRIGMFNAYTSLLGNKYIIGIATAGKFGTKRVVKQLVDLIQGVFQFGKITGTLPFARGWKRIEEYPKIIEKAKQLGLKMVRDIETKKRYIFQKIGMKLLHKLILKKIFIHNVIANKNGEMRGVYENLVSRGFMTSKI